MTVARPSLIIKGGKQGERTLVLDKQPKFMEEILSLAEAIAEDKPSPHFKEYQIKELAKESDSNTIQIEKFLLAIDLFQIVLDCKPSGSQEQNAAFEKLRKNAKPTQDVLKIQILTLRRRQLEDELHSNFGKLPITPQINKWLNEAVAKIQEADDKVRNLNRQGVSGSQWDEIEKINQEKDTLVQQIKKWIQQLPAKTSKVTVIGGTVSGATKLASQLGTTAGNAQTPKVEIKQTPAKVQRTPIEMAGIMLTALEKQKQLNEIQNLFQDPTNLPDLKTPIKNGMNLIHWIAAWGRPDVLEFAIQKGIIQKDDLNIPLGPEAKDEHKQDVFVPNRTALDLALKMQRKMQLQVQNFGQGQAHLAQFSAVVDLLKKHGAKQTLVEKTKAEPKTLGPPSS